MESILPQGLTMRPATLDDIDMLYSLSHAYDISQYGEDGEEEYTREDIRIIFSGPNMNLERDTRLVFDREGRLVGLLLLENYKHVKFSVGTRIHPSYSDPRLGDYLVELGEAWAREQMAQAEPGVRVTIAGWTSTTDSAAIARYERAGFQEVRRHWRMEIKLNEEPAVPVWPDGVELRPFVPERDKYAVYRAIDTAFQDHWGHVSHTFEQWQHWMLERADFDPTLWFIAWEGEQVAGGSLCVIEGQWGWVSTLGVLRTWRRKGLGMALLQHSFGEFYRRGLRKAGLGVDSQNLTGATRLYRRAGMHVARETITYEKELRVGVELSTQTLAV
jgi:ribosomal protein S18 acetylase RimI-like enzyme